MSCFRYVFPFLLTLSSLLNGLSLPVNAEQPSDHASKTSYLLRHRFQVGEFVHYNIVDQSRLTTRKGDHTELMLNESDVKRHYRVVSIAENGDAVLELMIDEVKLKAQFDDAPPTVFDSTSPGEQSSKFRSILNSIQRPMTRLRVNERGELISIQDLLAGQTQQVDPAINFLVVFPESAVSIGESWKQTLELEVPITNTVRQPVKLLRTYTLKSVTGHIATIELSTSLLTGVRDLAVRTRTLQQTPHGFIEFDLKTNQMLSRKLTMNGQVVGAFGEGTVFEARGTRNEKLLPVEATAQKQTENQLSDTK